MPFRGDTRSLSLSDVFQNLLQNKQTGTLTVTPAGERPAFLWLRDGAVQLFSPGTASAEYLPLLLKQRAGATDDEIARGLKKGGRNKGLTAVLTKMGAVTDDRVADALRFFCEERIYDLFALDDATFEFAEGQPDATNFDADQRAVELGLDTNKVLFEAARRTDEWGLIRKKILSRLESFSVPPEKRAAVEGLEDRLLQRVANLCDGSRNVSQVIDDSAEGAFTVSKAITDLLGKGLVRPVATDELDRLAESARQAGDLPACIEYCQQALERERNRPATRERLAGALEASGNAEAAATEWKLLAAAQIDAGRTERAIEAYRRAASCLPRDTAVREQLLRLLIDVDGDEIAVHEGRDLALTYRELGMPEKVRDTYRRLLDLRPDDPQLPQLLADAHIELGDKPGAQTVLWEHARSRAEGGLEAEALPLLKALAKIAPGHAQARQLLADIESGNLEKRLARKRRRKRVLGALVVVGLLLGYGVYDGVARFACDAAGAQARTLFLNHQADAAIARCDAEVARWPLTRAAAVLRQQAAAYRGRLDVAQQIAAALQDGKPDEAAALIQDARDQAGQASHTHAVALTAYLHGRFRTILERGATAEALTAALVAEADVLGTYRPAYAALLGLFVAQIDDHTEGAPDIARWRGIIEALLVLRVHAGRATDVADRFTLRADQDPAAALRILKQSWRDEHAAVRAELGLGG